MAQCHRGKWPKLTKLTKLTKVPQLHKVTLSCRKILQNCTKLHHSCLKLHKIAPNYKNVHKIDSKLRKIAKFCAKLIKIAQTLIKVHVSFVQHCATVANFVDFRKLSTPFVNNIFWFLSTLVIFPYDVKPISIISSSSTCHSRNKEIKSDAKSFLAEVIFPRAVILIYFRHNFKL